MEIYHMKLKELRENVSIYLGLPIEMEK